MVHLEGIEPPSLVPKTRALSVKLQVHVVGIIAVLKEPRNAELF